MAGILEAIFRGPQRLILCALFAEPAKLWTSQQLAGKLGLPERSVRRLLTLLHGSGVVRSQRNASRVACQPDPACPVYRELYSLIGKLAAFSAERTILVVEDQEATAQITRILLENWGYRVLEARSGIEAIEVFQQARGQISLLLADILLPGMNGVELAERLREIQPDLPVVFMSGSPDGAASAGRTPFLPKPFNPVSLARVVRRQFEQIKAA